MSFQEDLALYASARAIADRAEADGYCDGDSGASNVIASIERRSPDALYEWNTASTPDAPEAASYDSYEADYRRGYRNGFYRRMRSHNMHKPRK